jgi:hypothetical protein
MNLNYHSILAAILILATPFASYAGSLRCGGSLISPGNTEQELLDACGAPTRSEGSEWLYERSGKVPVVVTVNRGVVSFIRNKAESGAFSKHPFGDRP